MSESHYFRDISHVNQLQKAAVVLGMVASGLALYSGITGENCAVDTRNPISWAACTIPNDEVKVAEPLTWIAAPVNELLNDS